MVLMVHGVCCEVIWGGIFTRGDGTGKMDGLYLWVEMWEMFVLMSAFG